MRKAAHAFFTLPQEEKMEYPPQKRTCGPAMGDRRAYRLWATTLKPIN